MHTESTGYSYEKHVKAMDRWLGLMDAIHLKFPCVGALAHTCDKNA